MLVSLVFFFRSICTNLTYFEWHAGILSDQHLEVSRLSVCAELCSADEFCA